MQFGHEPDPSPDDIDAVLAFLPVLEQPAFEPGAMRAPEPHDGEPEPPHFEANLALVELMQALADHHFISGFDWAEWQGVAERYVENPGLLADAGLGTVRKLFTTAVQKERFAEGHLATVVRSGHLTALLRRLKAIRANLKS